MTTTANSETFARRLESEGLATLADRPFSLTRVELDQLTDDLPRDGAKSFSLSPGVDINSGDTAALLMRRYADWSEALVRDLAPAYAALLERGRTSLRPRPVAGDALSPRKDDRRLHVDAFASQPTAGRRILRVFSNINPHGEARLWQVGEPFETHARRWLGRLRPPLPGETWLLHRLGITKARRTAYDALMLGLHDAAKLDIAYQRDAPRRDIAFAAGTSWIVFTDSTVHAALAGRHALEQTFYLPVAAMLDADRSPLNILERLTGRNLV